MEFVNLLDVLTQTRVIISKVGLILMTLVWFKTSNKLANSISNTSAITRWNLIYSNCQTQPSAAVSCTICTCFLVHYARNSCKYPTVCISTTKIVTCYRRYCSVWPCAWNCSTMHACMQNHHSVRIFIIGKIHSHYLNCWFIISSSSYTWLWSYSY